MRLRTRYLASLLALLAVMTAPVLYGMYRVGDLRAIAVDLRQQAAGTAVAAGRLSRQLAELDRNLTAYVATTDADLADRVAATLGVIQQQLDTLAAHGYTEFLTDDALPVGSLRMAVGRIEAMVRADELEEATIHLATVARPLLARADRSVVHLSRAVDRSTAARAAEAERAASATITATGMAVVVSVVVALLLGWLVARLLTRPLDRLRHAMGAVAEGDLTAPHDPALHRRDEVGDLFRSFRIMTGRLAQLDRMKAEFVAIASRDLKTPIDIISGYTELIDEADIDGDTPRREVVRALRKQARALGDRLNHLIEISRLEARGLRLGLEEINLRHLATAIETQFAPAAVRHGVDLAVSVAPETPTFMVADPDCLRNEVVGNLLEHAIKFSPQDSTVRVHFEGGSGVVRIHVTDHGPAVPTTESASLFDPYFRGSAVGRVGSGTGLPMAHAGVEAHGGAIAVESDDTATRFVVTLPLRPARPGSPLPHRASDPAGA